MRRWNTPHQYVTLLFALHFPWNSVISVDCLGGMGKWERGGSSGWLFELNRKEIVNQLVRSDTKVECRTSTTSTPTALKSPWKCRAVNIQRLPNCQPIGSTTEGRSSTISPPLIEACEASFNQISSFCWYHLFHFDGFDWPSRFDFRRGHPETSA